MLAARRSGCSSEERRGDGLSCSVRSGLVADQRAIQRWSSGSRIGLYRRQPRGGLDDVVVDTVVAIWSIGAVSGNGGVDQIWVKSGHRLVAKTEALHCSRPEILDKDISAFHQGFDDL